ncbi:epoxyqueuosine reductase [Longilinea arvoryzae]|uniref:Epoxyqueuosine reductase n=1 Tax=Longilinea arvoryzae TaxID=360412 RepID=A0A0S7BIV9_9CHLR|nr:tRNA epoxyqueuosine(34) reductase QueG [Longilinea arvoryzae]GAP14390.1 epoxyqueuosine reductase [Longilinea arvoryzae]
MQIRNWIKAEAASLGFPFFGITDLTPPPHLDVFRDWIAAGRHAGMDYLGRGVSLDKRSDPRQILPGAKSIITLAMPYAPSLDSTVEQSQPAGRIASYAWGMDYHEVIPARLNDLAERISEHLGCPVARRAYTDTGPILERDLAQRAGLGWAGKNSCLIHPRRGSYFFLAELFLDIELEPDKPIAIDRCGSCRRCIDACPTGCICEDRTLDAGRCVSYLTIENKGPIPVDLRPRIGNRVFGCDICQQVCPWNRFAVDNEIDPTFQPRPGIPAPSLLPELQLDARAFNRKFQLSPVKRAKRRGYLRNVCIALGNSHNPAALPALKEILQAEPEALIRGAAAWALAEIDPVNARSALEIALRVEPDAIVCQEIKAALEK